MKRSSMVHHLYKNKKPCPKSINNIDLTNEIKEHIVNNKVYHIEPSYSKVTCKTINQTFNQQINHYHQISNYVTSLSVEEKLSKYLHHKQQEITDFEDEVEEKYLSHVNKLEKNKVNNYQLNIDNMLQVIDEVTAICNNAEHFNIYYDEVPNKLKLFSGGTWKTSLLDIGVREMIEMIKGCYLDAYEAYLLRKLYNTQTSCFSKVQAKERLEEYYKFIACFNVTPSIEGKYDVDIIESLDDSVCISERFMKVYKQIKDNITMAECSKTRKCVYDIIKRNTKTNIVDLNKMIMDMLQIDTEFKTNILDDISRLYDVKVA